MAIRYMGLETVPSSVIPLICTSITPGWPSSATVPDVQLRLNALRAGLRLMDRSLCTQPPYNGGAYQRSPERNRSLFVEEYDPTNIDPIVQLQILPSQPGKKIRPYSIHVTGFSGTKALRIERYNQSVSLNTQVIQTLSINPNSRQLVTFNGQAHDADFLLFVCTGKGNNSFFVDLLAFELV